MSPQGCGKLVNAALLSLIHEACVNVCCATVVSSELVGPTCVESGRVGLVGMDRGGEDIQWRCTCLFTPPGF